MNKIKGYFYFVQVTIYIISMFILGFIKKNLRDKKFSSSSIVLEYIHTYQLHIYKASLNIKEIVFSIWCIKKKCMYIIIICCDR